MLQSVVNLFKNDIWATVGRNMFFGYSLIIIFLVIDFHKEPTKIFNFNGLFVK